MIGRREVKKFLFISILLGINSLSFSEERLNSIKLDDTVVTSENSKGTVGSISKNITILTAEEINERGAKTVAEALKYVSNITVKEMAGTDASFDMRGQGSTAASNVLVMVDGVPMNSIDMSGYKTSQIPIDSVEKIEVIPSGGSVLYGDGAIGGMINIVTKNPKEKTNYGNVSFTMGSYDLKEGQVTYGTTVGKKLLLELNYMDRKKEGYRSYQKDNLEAFSLRSKYLLDKGSLGFKYNYYKTKFKAPGSLSKEELNDDRQQSSLNGWRIDGNTEKNRFTGDYVYNIRKDLEFKFLGDFSKENYKSKSKYGPRNYKTDVIYLKPQVKYNYLEDNYLVLGTDYYRGKTNIENDSEIKKESLGVYAINNFNLGDFNFTQGYRRQDVKYKTSSNKFRDKTFKENAFELSGSYGYSDTGKTYLSYTRAFRSPNTDELGFWDPNNDFKSQKTDTYELGIKDYIGNVYISTSIFHIETKNEIYYGLIDSEHSKNKNYDGKTKRKGIDISFEEYFGKLKLSQSVTYLHTEFENNKAIPGIPKIKGVFNINYQLTEKINLNNSWEYYGKMFKNSDDKNEGKKLDDYILTGINIQYKLNERFILEGGVKNLFNEKYYDYVSYSSWRDSYYPAPERNYYGKITYIF